MKLVIDSIECTVCTHWRTFRLRQIFITRKVWYHILNYYVCTYLLTCLLTYLHTTTKVITSLLESKHKRILLQSIPMPLHQLAVSNAIVKWID